MGTGPFKRAVYKKRVNVEQEYFSRSEIGKIFSVSIAIVTKWEKEGIILRTYLPTREARYHARELTKIADSIYGEPQSAQPNICRENHLCVCRNKWPESPVDSLRDRVANDRLEAKRAIQAYSVDRTD